MGCGCSKPAAKEEQDLVGGKQNGSAKEGAKEGRALSKQPSGGGRGEARKGGLEKSESQKRRDRGKAAVGDEPRQSPTAGPSTPTAREASKRSLESKPSMEGGRSGEQRSTIERQRSKSLPKAEGQAAKENIRSNSLPKDTAKVQAKSSSGSSSSNSGNRLKIHSGETKLLHKHSEASSDGGHSSTSSRSSIPQQELGGAAAPGFQAQQAAAQQAFEEPKLLVDPLKGHPRYLTLEEMTVPQPGPRRFVQLYEDKRDGNPVSIKFVPRGSQAVRAASREIQNLRLCVANKYISQFREVFLTQQYLVIVMEHTPGYTLTQYLELYRSQTPGEGLPEHVCRWFFQQLIMAVDFCHAMGIANRNLTPENALVTKEGTNGWEVPGAPPAALPDKVDGHHVPSAERLKELRQIRVKLCDFGMSKDENTDSSCKTACGSPNFVAPEILLYNKYDGKLADIWSCGVLLYVMLTGHGPFNLESERGLAPTAMLQKMFPRIVNAEYELPPFASPKALDLLKQMLTVEPTQRITLAAIMAHPWFRRDMPKNMQSAGAAAASLLEDSDDDDLLMAGMCGQSEEDVRHVCEKAAQPVVRRKAGSRIPMKPGPPPGSIIIPDENNK